MVMNAAGRVFLCWVPKHSDQVGHATVLRRRTISGPRGPVTDVYTEHNTHSGGVFPAVEKERNCTSFRARMWVSSYAMAWTRWDKRQLVLAALVTLVTLTLVWLVTAATDEGGVSWGERAGRALPLTPLCATVGAWAALAPVLSRGEALALEALGRSRPQIALAAVLGGAAVALAAALGLGLASAVDVTGFFPTATHASAWTWNGAAFVDALHGQQVGADGAPARVAAEVGSRAMMGIPRFGRAASAMVTAMAGLALPLLLAHTLFERARLLFSVVAAVTAIAATVVSFQAAAAGQVPAVMGAAPSLALLVFAVRRYRGERV